MLISLEVCFCLSVCLSVTVLPLFKNYINRAQIWWVDISLGTYVICLKIVRRQVFKFLIGYIQ